MSKSQAPSDSSWFSVRTRRLRNADEVDRAFSLGIEALERRCLLSASPRLAYGPDLATAIPATSTPAENAPIKVAPQADHLVIDPIFDSTITRDSKAAAIEADLNQMIQNFESDITTPITVTVKFEEITTGLADSLTYHVQETYSAYLAALTARATSTTDKTAIATLPKGTTNPVNGGANISLTDANARALGFTATPPGGIDSTIGLNMSAFNLGRFADDINPDDYDLIGSSSHEMDEVLAIDSALNAYNNNEAIPTTYVSAEDLFRYTVGSTQRSFSTNENVESAFSFNGGTGDVARFNQTEGGDFNDWYSPADTVVPQVQDAYGTPGATPNLGTELTVLDTLGYTLASGVIGGFKPDLVPAALQGWSSPLVLTTTKNALVDSPALTTSDTIYLDAAIQNNGEYQTTTAETNIITLDGKAVFTFSDPSGLATNNAYFSVGLSLGKLTAGTHTISISADTGNTVAEIIESNNTFTRTFTVAAAVVPLPDLQPYTPQGWSSPLVVTTSSTGTTESSQITTADEIYVSFAYANEGTAPVTSSFTVLLKLNGTTVYTLDDTSEPYAAGDYGYDQSLDAGKEPAGTYSLEMVIDSSNNIAESNENNNTYTQTFTVVAPAVAPAVTTQPKSQSVSAGTKVTLTAAASGTPTPTVQWQLSTNAGKSYTNISGATSTTYSLTAAAGQTGDYYRAVFTNSKGTATTSAAILTVSAAPLITTQPVSQSALSGAKVTLIAAASGVPAPTVQWQVSTNGGKTYTNISRATSTTYSLTASLSGSGYYYRAVFTNSTGTATTTAAILTVTALPVVTKQPTSQSVTAGTKVTLTAAASGTPTPTVQWQVSTNAGKSYANISGATSTTYSFTAATSQTGDYFRAVFTNAAGTASTTAAVLKISVSPDVIEQVTAAI